MRKKNNWSSITETSPWVTLKINELVLLVYIWSCNNNNKNWCSFHMVMDWESCIHSNALQIEKNGNEGIWLGFELLTARGHSRLVSKWNGPAPSQTLLGGWLIILDSACVVLCCSAFWGNFVALLTAKYVFSAHYVYRLAKRRLLSFIVSCRSFSPWSG